MNKIKNTIVAGLGMIAFCLFAISTSAQVKVHAPNGDTGIGPGFSAGTITPTQKLDVDGNMNVRGPQLYVGDDAGSAGTILFVGRNRTANGNSGFNFYNNTSGSPTFRLAVSNAGISGFTHTGTQQLRFTTADAADISFRTNSSNRLFIRSNGDVDVLGDLNATGGNTVSDSRLKENVQDFNIGLDAILKLDPKTYNYNGKAGISTKRTHTGLIAQDFQKIVPHAVNKYSYEVETDDDTKGAIEEYLMIDEKVVQYALVNAIKEQQSMLEAKEDRINELELKLNEVYSMIQEISENGLGINETNVTLSSFDLANLDQNNPNPFNGTTSIKYTVPSKSTVAQINILNLNGKVMKSIDLDHIGEGVININAIDMPSGAYAYQMVVDGKIVDTKKMVLTK